MGRAFKLGIELMIVCCAMCVLPTFALASTEGRKYEMVSPPYKGGFGAKRVEAVASNGETVMFYSPGAFAGAPSGGETMDYLARRDVGGWTTTPMMTPAGSMQDVIERDVSSNLGTTLALGKLGTDVEEASVQGAEEEFLLHPTNLLDTNTTWSGGGMAFKTTPEEPITLVYRGASPDFCHLLFQNLSSVGILLPEEVPGAGGLYELNRGCNGEPALLRLVGVKNSNGPHNEPAQVEHLCGGEAAEVGIRSKGPEGVNSFNAIADDGKEIFFTTCVGGLQDHSQLFVRLDGARTLEISKPLSPPAPSCDEVPCAGAEMRANSFFVGASEDGSRVFFTTKEPLVASDTGESNNLYMATIGCPEGASTCDVSERIVTSLTQVSHNPNGGEAALQGVTALSPDGTRIYFVASGDLLDAMQTAALEGEGRTVPNAGADNLYVYDANSGTTSFIGELCAGFELSGSIEDASCPSKVGSDAPLWDTFADEAQTGGENGRFLVFSTYAQLTSSDTDSAKDVYRYDAQTGELDRVSSGEAGSDANGNDSSFDAGIPLKHWGGERVQLQYELDNRAISEDGSRIVFESAAPLSATATNGLMNVYEWHNASGEAGEGTVSLISGGNASEPVEDAVISPQGNDVFFVTVQGLVAQDTDGAQDVYDARLGGGFPEGPAEPEPCSGDACQGSLTNPAPLLIPGSVSQAPGGNLTSVKHATSPKKKKAKKKSRLKKKSKKHKAKRAVRRQHSLGRATAKRGERR